MVFSASGGSLFRLCGEAILGTRYGYFVPADGAYAKVRVCDDDCRCGRGKLVRGHQLLLEWEAGDQGDLAVGLGPLLANSRFRKMLAATFPELHFEPIQVIKPRRLAAALAREYFEIQARRCFIVDPRIGSVRERCACSRCGRASYEVIGIEQRPGEMKIGDRWEPAPGVPRSPGQGALIPRRLTEGESFFHLNGMLLCDQRGRDFLEGHEFSNISFLEYGELVD